MKKIKATKNELIGIYRLLDETILLKVEDKLGVLKVMRVLKPIAAEFDEIMKDTQEKLHPEDWDEMVAWYQELKQEGRLTDTDVSKMEAYLKDYNNEVNKCVIDELAKVVEVEIDPLSEETITQVSNGNAKLTAGQTLTLIEMLGK